MLLQSTQEFFVSDNGDYSSPVSVYGSAVEEPAKVFVVNQPTITDAASLTVVQPTPQTTSTPTDQVQQPTGTTTPDTTATGAKPVDDKVSKKMWYVAIAIVVIIGVALFLTFKNAGK